MPKVFKTLLEAIHTQATRQPATKKIQEETQKKIQERSQINNLTLQHKELQKEQTKPKASRKKEVKIRGEINKIENRK